MKHPSALRRRLRRFKESKKGVQIIVAELLVILIVLIMSVTVFVFYSGVFGALLQGTRLNAENFTIVGAGSPSAGVINASAVQPSGSPPSLSTSGTVCTSSNPINTPVTGGVYVPPGQSCTITASVSSGVQVNYGASLTVQGASISGGIMDNRSASISIQNAAVSGSLTLYGTGSLTLTGGQFASGSVKLNGVKYATISTTNPISGGLTANNGGSVQIDSITYSGGATISNNQIVRMTNNSGTGGLTFSSDPNCYQANNSISPGISGTCTGGAPSGELDILNTGSSTVSFSSLYLDNQPWSGISWQLASGSTEQCGNTAIPVGACTLFPIVIPPNMMVHLSFSWVNPTPTSPVKILMWTQLGNYLEARVDPTAGLVCSTRSMDSPREPIGFC